jgi:hypothetical protein
MSLPHWHTPHTMYRSYVMIMTPTRTRSLRPAGQPLGRAAFNLLSSSPPSESRHSLHVHCRRYSLPSATVPPSPPPPPRGRRGIAIATLSARSPGCAMASGDGRACTRWKRRRGDGSNGFNRFSHAVGSFVELLLALPWGLRSVLSSREYRLRRARMHTQWFVQVCQRRGSLDKNTPSSMRSLD